MRLFDVFRGPQFTLLGFGEPDVAESFERRYPGLLRARTVSGTGRGDLVDDGQNKATYDASGNALFLIRPDGYIGAVSESPATIHRYLAGVGGH